MATKFRVALTATRVIVLAVLIAILAGPYLKIDHQITKRPIVAILFDESQSMNLPAGPFASEEELLAVAVAEGKEVKEGEMARRSNSRSPSFLDQRLRGRSYVKRMSRF